MSIKPLHDRVVVKPIEADEISAGGIVIPDSVSYTHLTLPTILLV